MENKKFQNNYDTSIDDDLNELNPFKKEFQSTLENELDLAEMFNEELKHVQKLALIGKLNPKHKVTLIEWLWYVVCLVIIFNCFHNSYPTLSLIQCKALIFILFLCYWSAFT